MNENQTTDCCKFCSEPVNLQDSGVTYKDGQCAHDDCHDAEQFRLANAFDRLTEAEHNAFPNGRWA